MITNKFNVEPSASQKIFSLRKENNLEAAFSLLLSNLPAGYPENKLSLSQDKWLTIAALNVFLDLLKEENSRSEKNQERINQLKFLISGLDVSGDNQAQARINRVINESNPFFYLIEKVNKIPKKEKNDLAINLLEEYRNNTHDTSYDLSLAWRIYYYITEQLSTDKYNVLAIKQLLNKYLHLDIPDKKIIHSMILISAKNLKKKLDDSNRDKEFRFFSFVRIWGLDNLSNEDWQSNDPKYKSLAESVISMCAKELSSYERISNDDISYFLPFIKEAISKNKNDVWIYLYYARILAKSNMLEDAKDNYVVVLKEKKTESWIWNELGELLKETDIQIALSCYCRALICGASEEFKVNIHRNLGNLLIQMNDLEHAKSEYKLYSKIKTSPLSTEDNNILTSEWFSKTKEATDQKEFYQKHSDYAEELFFDNLQKIEAIVGRDYSYFDKTKERKVSKKYVYANIKGQFAFSNIETESIPLEIQIKQNQLDKTIHEGQSILLKGEMDSSKRFNIFRIEKIDSLSKNIITPLIGIVSFINFDNKYLNLVIDKGCSVKVDFEQIRNIKYYIGLGLKVTVSYRYNKDQKPCFSVIKVINTVPDEEIPSYLKKTFDGILEIREGNKFGFVGDIFVPDKIISSSKVKNQDYVSGTASISFNKKKNSWSYSAISICKK